MAGKESSEKQDAQELSNASEKQDETESVEPEILKHIPPEFKQIVEVGMARLGPVPNPLLQKITSEHIDKILVLAGGGFGVKTYLDRNSS